MKKSLSLLIALAMVFGMFASMASAATAELTTAQKYQLFVDQGVLKGDPSGNPRLDATLTRAEFATIVASVGGLKLVNTTSSFSDVKAKDWYFTAIQSASDAGLVNGIGAGKFGPKLNVTVEQVIKVAVILANIKPVDGAVVAGSSAWAGPYIQAAINAGLAVPSNYKANATRGQTIDVAYVVAQLKSLPVLSDVTATVNADDTITVSGKVVGTADSVKVALGTATAVAATLKDDKTFTYTTAKQTAGTYKLTVVAYDGTKASVAVEKEVTIGGFVVESATAVNNKQIAIKFNKAVQEGISVGGATYALSNDAASNVLLNGVAPKAASISADKMTVTYTFAAFTNNTYAQLEVKSGYKSASGQSLTAYKTAILLNDTTAPTVTGVSYAGNTATITFSESIPADKLGTISVNGSEIKTGVTSAVYYSTNVDTSDALGWVSGITVKNLTLGTNYSFYLVGGADNVGNRFDYNTTLNAPTDSVAPTITSLTVNGNVITAKFSEAVSAAGSVYNGSDASSKVDGVRSSDNLSATYTVGWLGSNSFVNVTAVVKGYKDLVGNTGADFSQAVSLTKDTTAPTIASASYDGTYIVIKFSEPVAVNSTAGNIKWSWTNTNSVVNSNTWSAASAVAGYDVNNDGDVADDTENYYIRVTPSTSVGAGSWTITVPGGLAKDLSGQANVNADGSASFTVSAGSTSGIIKLTKVEVVDNTNNSKVKFTFDRDLATSALDVSKYTINGVALPTGTKLYFEGTQQVVAAEVPAGTFPVAGSRVVKVNNIVDTSGNTLSDTNSATLFFNENVAPVAQTVTLVSDKQLNVSFSETIANNGAVSGVSVYLNGSTTAETGLTVVAADGIVKITTTANDSRFSLSQTISVKFASSNAKDAAGNSAADITINK